jgi:hypothetical protein
MKWNTKIALVLSLALFGPAIEAQADCHILRGAISETRIEAPNDPISRLLGIVTGTLSGASTVVITSPPPNTTSLDIFLTNRGDTLIAVGFPTRTPIPGAPPGEFTVHVDLTITGGSGKYEGATGAMTFDGFSHAGGPGVGTAELVYRGSVCGPNLNAGE